MLAIPIITCSWRASTYIGVRNISHDTCLQEVSSILLMYLIHFLERLMEIFHTNVAAINVDILLVVNTLAV